MSVSNSITSIDEYGSLVLDPVNCETASDDRCNLNNLAATSETKPPRRRRWRFLLRRKHRNNYRGPAVGGAVNCKGPSMSCGCKSAVKGSCLILISSFVELLGCLFFLLYGLFYIEKASDFYSLDSEPEKRGLVYDEKLEQLHFLDEHTIGFVGLLATCIVGIIIAFLMPLGTILRSWKCLRGAMTLLFSVILVHLMLVIFYLPRTGLVISVVVIPFRVYEIFLITNYIKYYKKKKVEALRERCKGGRAGCSNSAVCPLIEIQSLGT